MKSIILAVLFAVGLTACAVPLTERDQRVGSGAVIGGAAGAALTRGSPVGIIGGAIAGGLVGNAVDQNAKADERDAREAQRDAQYRQEQARRDYELRYDNCRRYNSARFCDNNVR